MKVTGHRGARGLAPENTVASLLKGIEHGVEELECDVRVTRDGVPVLAHDAHLTDQAGNRLAIAGTTLAALREHKADLSSLAAAIEAVNRHVPLIIEVKPGTPTGPIVTTLQQYLRRGWPARDFLLSSRSQPILRELHACLPEIQKVVIDYWSGVRATRHARQVGTKRISMLETWLWPGFVRAMKRGGYELYSFPNKTPAKERFFARLGLGGASNNPAKARKWAKYGLAGVITDFPDRFKHSP